MRVLLKEIIMKLGEKMHEKPSGFDHANVSVSPSSIQVLCVGSTVSA